jgi:SNF2 family DNA or RNA helicase
MPKQLFPYQRDAVLKALGQPYFLNAMEMGTGKTATTLGELPPNCTALDSKLRILVVTLNSAKSVWEDEIADAFPDVPCVILDRKNRQQSWQEFTDNGWGFLVVHWDVVGSRITKIDGKPVDQLYMPQLRSIEWDYIIADEATAIKNRQAKRTKAFKKIKGKHKRALTGKPIVNRPDEAWSLLNWMDRKEWPSYWKFFDAYVNSTEDYFGYKHVIGPKNTEDFRARIEPYSVFVKKSDVLPHLIKLPPQIIRLNLEPEQLRAYKEMESNDFAWIGSQDPYKPLPAPTVLARLTRLRQFCTAYATLDPDTDQVLLTEPSSKLDALMDILESSDEPIVVFTQYRQLLELATRRFEKAKVSFVEFHGGVTDEDRKTAVKSFQQEDGPRVFISTIQSGGMGITLTRAATAVFLDRSWSPAMNQQAEDRIHRYGQTRPVHIILLQARGTVDEVVEARLQMKAEWFRQMFEGS